LYDTILLPYNKQRVQRKERPVEKVGMRTKAWLSRVIFITAIITLVVTGYLMLGYGEVRSNHSQEAHFAQLRNIYQGITSGSPDGADVLHDERANSTYVTTTRNADENCEKGEKHE
jgi:hypothetical protein